MRKNKEGVFIHEFIHVTMEKKAYEKTFFLHVPSFFFPEYYGFSRQSPFLKLYTIFLTILEDVCHPKFIPFSYNSPEKYAIIICNSEDKIITTLNIPDLKTTKIKLPDYLF